MEELAQLIKKYREELDLTIEQVSDRTKIRKFVLNAIESGELDKLPPVYGKSFIKTYINFLEIPESEYIELYDEATKKLAAPKTTYNPVINNNYGPLDNNYKVLGVSLSPTVINYSIYSAIVLIIAIIIYLSVFNDSKPKQDNIISTRPPTDSIELKRDEIQLNSPTLRDSILLEAFAIDSAWIKVEMDGNKVDQVLMTPDMKRQWKAKDYFIIHQGNIGGLEIKRNGKILEPFGSPGRSVKNVKITNDKVIYQ